MQNTIVFTLGDAIIAQVAERAPSTLEGLRAVPGMSGANMAYYGARLLKVVTTFISTEAQHLKHDRLGAAGAEWRSLGGQGSGIAAGAGTPSSASPPPPSGQWQGGSPGSGIGSQSPGTGGDCLSVKVQVSEHLAAHAMSLVAETKGSHEEAAVVWHATKSLERVAAKRPEKVIALSTAIGYLADVLAAGRYTGAAQAIHFVDVVQHSACSNPCSGVA